MTNVTIGVTRSDVDVAVRLRARQMLWRWAQVVQDSSCGVRSTRVIGERSGAKRDFVRSDYLTVSGIVREMGYEARNIGLVRWIFGRSKCAEDGKWAEQLLSRLMVVADEEVLR